MSDDGTDAEDRLRPAEQGGGSEADPRVISIDASRATVCASPIRSSRSVLESDGPLSITGRLVEISTSQAGAGKQPEQDPASECLAQLLAETHALAAIAIAAIDVAFAEECVSARGMGMKRGAPQVHGPGQTEGFVGERDTVGGVALDPGDTGEECQRIARRPPRRRSSRPTDAASTNISRRACTRSAGRREPLRSRARGHAPASAAGIDRAAPRRRGERR